MKNIFLIFVLSINSYHANSENSYLKYSAQVQPTIMVTVDRPPVSEFIVMEHYKNLSLEDIPGEEWKDVVGYEGLYQVSNFGRVKSLPRKMGKIRREWALILSQKIDKYGYPVVRLMDYPRNQHPTAHRLVALAFLPNTRNKPQVNHKSGIKIDNRVENLEWATAQENIQHSVRTGLQVNKCGAEAHRALFSNCQVREIRNLLSSGHSVAELCRIYNVCRGTIVSIRKCKTYINA